MQSFRLLAAIHDLDDATFTRRIADLGALLEADDLYTQPVRSLSLGQRMRCELTACLLHEPAILFLDEPTIGLDLLAKQRFRELLVLLNEERGTTVFLTSHDVADIEYVARRVVVINHGSVIYDDDVDLMRRTLLSTKLIDVSLGHPVEFAARPGVTVTEHTPSVLKLAVDTRAHAVRDIVDGLLSEYPVTDLSIVDPPLEQVIGEIYGAPAQ
jgi:ABC-2 type transport system ATP-binding protein